jgi:hypothetical protein
MEQQISVPEAITTNPEALKEVNVLACFLEAQTWK